MIWTHWPYIFLVFFYFFAVSRGYKCGPAEYLTGAEQCCPMCGKGLVVHKDCTEESSTTCIPCLRGTFMNEPNGLDKCFKCKTCDEEQGLVTSIECTTTSNTVCGVRDGYHCESPVDKECIFAVKHTVCRAGQRIAKPGTKKSDVVCEDCPDGFYSVHGLNCTPWTDCALTGRKKIKEGSPSEDTLCEKSARTYYSSLSSVLLLLLVAVVLARITYLNRKPSVHEESEELKYPVPESANSTSDGAGAGAANNLEEQEEVP